LQIDWPTAKDGMVGVIKMCGGYEDFYDVDFYETLAKLFNTWKQIKSEFMCDDEEIRNYDWIEGFLSELRRLLPELKDNNFSEYADLFKVRGHFKDSKVFEISFDKGKAVVIE